MHLCGVSMARVLCAGVDAHGPVMASDLSADKAHGYVRVEEPSCPGKDRQVNLPVETCLKQGWS